MASDGTTNQYHHGDLHNALLTAAGALLREQGTGGVSLREVARRAGVSHTAPYRHFSSKAALLAALAQRGFRQLEAAIMTAAERVPHGPEQQLIAAGIAYVRHAVSNPEVIRLMFGETPEATGAVEAGAAGRQVFTALQSIMEAGIQSGVFRQREAGELALVAWTSMHGLAMLVTAGMLPMDTTDPDAVETLVGAVAGNVIYGISR
jgi:AcrR family transcriptional regulator